MWKFWQKDPTSKFEELLSNYEGVPIPMEWNHDAQHSSDEAQAEEWGTPLDKDLVKVKLLSDRSFTYRRGPRISCELGEIVIVPSHSPRLAIVVELGSQYAGPTQRILSKNKNLIASMLEESK